MKFIVEKSITIMEWLVNHTCSLPLFMCSLVGWDWIQEWIKACIIVNRGDWLWSLANIKGAKKDAKIYVGRPTTVHNLLFCAHTLCMNYVTNTFLLVSSTVRSKQLLCVVQGQVQKREQKHKTNNIDEFHNHSPPLTMLAWSHTKGKGIHSPLAQK